MKHKKVIKHVQLFLLDHLMVIMLFLFAPLGFTSSYILINGNVKDLFYYVFLSLFALLCYLGYRLYSTWNFYELLCSDKVLPEDFLAVKPRCKEEKHYRLIVKQLYDLYLSDVENQKEIQRTNKTLIYRWIHQLKTPLSVIKLVSENHKSESDYKKIIQSANQIQYDLDQILNMYKLDDIKNDFHTEKVCLYDISKECINDLKNNFISHGIFPKLNIPSNIHVYTDLKWIKFCLYQLLTNAIKYSDTGDSVYVYVENEGNRICLHIKDEGCGIDKTDIPRIFDQFFTGKNGRLRGESSGLGLYMVKQILDYLGHDIEVESIKDEGSNFSIIFDKN